MDKIRVKDGRELDYSSHMAMPKRYADFSIIYDWCENSFGEFDQNWSTVYAKNGIIWNFINREDLVLFELTWQFHGKS